MNKDDHMTPKTEPNPIVRAWNDRGSPHPFATFSAGWDAAEKQMAVGTVQPDDVPFPYLPMGWIICHSEQYKTYRAEGEHERGDWMPTRQAATAQAWARACEALRTGTQQPVNSAEGVLAAICDAFHIGSAVRTPETLMANVENAIRRSRCLSVVEQHLTLETPPDPDEGDDEPGEECLLRWGAEPDTYAEHFSAALAQFLAVQTGGQSQPSRVLTYQNQPNDNVTAWRLGEACSRAAKAPGGDYIDGGLSLLKELQEKDFGVVAIDAARKAKE